MRQLQGKVETPMSEQAERIADLSSYLGKLMRHVEKQGKVVKIKGDPVQMAAVAILSGGIAVVETLLADVTVLAGHAKVQAKTLARPMVEMAVSRGAGALLDKIFGGK